MSTRIHYRLSRRRKRKVGDCIPLIEYAKKHSIHPDTVRYWIQKQRVIGYKFKGKWFVRDPVFGD